MVGWKGGKRCTLIDKEKSLRHSFKNGKLYLTHRYALQGQFNFAVILVSVKF